MTFSYPLALIGLLALPLLLWLGWPRTGFARTRALIALALRALIVIALVLALAGLQLITAADRLAVVFLVDASDSMPPAAVEASRTFIAESLRSMHPDDEAAIVLFGADALVERPMSPLREVGPFESQVNPLHTDLAEAIRLALALYPPGMARRMVILSDGLANVGDAEQAARLAAASGVQIVARPFEAAPGPEVLVAAVDVPTRLAQGQVFDLTVTIEASAETDALLRVFSAGEIVLEQPIALVEGVNRYAFTLTVAEPGLVSYRVQVVPASEDVFYQNNELWAFTQVVGPPHVLIVTDDPAESAHLEQALLAQGLSVDRAAALTTPPDLAALSAYQSVVLVNVPARSLGPRRMEALQSYVRDLGGGLVVVGGPNAYAPGGYFRTPLEETLPVEMQLKDQERLPQLTVLYVIDRSGSMADFSPGGYPKIELAKEAVLRSVELLGPLDRVGVLAFDTEASWIVPITPNADRADIARLVGGLRAGGGTDIYAGLLAASRVLPDDPSKVRHIVLLTDGGAEETGIADLVSQMYREHGITLSVIAITAQSEQYGEFLDDLPPLADGRFYHAYNADTIPEIFTEDTIIATRAYIIEREFYPTLTSSSPILSGITGTPPLLGYVGATVKPVAQQILATDVDDPLLAAWQYGLGRAIAWTSDATGRWAAHWAAWPDFARFWSQAVRWTITEGVGGNVEVRVQQQGEQVRIIVDAITEDGVYLNGLTLEANVVAPDLTSQAVPLQQVAPGRYEGAFTPQTEGAYFVRVAGGGVQGAAVAQISGWVLAYSPEYRTLEGDPDYLAAIARLGGGSFINDPQAVFAHNLLAERAAHPARPWLLLLATLLLPLDIAVRRLLITRADLAKWAMLLPIARRPEAAPLHPSRVRALLGVKQRVRRADQPAGVVRPMRDAAPPPPAAEEPPHEEAPPAPRPQAAPRRTASSLLERKRARRKPDGL